MSSDPKRRSLVYGPLACVSLLAGLGWWHHIRVEQAYAPKSVHRSGARPDPSLPDVGQALEGALMSIMRVNLPVRSSRHLLAALWLPPRAGVSHRS